MDPYKILGVSPSASDDEVKDAYRKLVKKYHPDRYVNTPLYEQAQEKLKQVNMAYDEIQNMRKNGTSSASGNPFQGYGSYGGYGGYNPYGSSSAGSGGDPDVRQRYRDIRQMLSMGLVRQAHEALSRMQDRSAEWYYLMSIIAMRTGQYAQAQSYASEAARLDPTNTEYAAAAQNMSSTFRDAQTVFRTGQAPLWPCLMPLCFCMPFPCC
ncbi:MAG: DnaJ domain-containing protein [Clostridia bacterium]|nr:DnaJ domain-containing protein [Clostridia bacterium]